MQCIHGVRITPVEIEVESVNGNYYTDSIQMHYDWLAYNKIKRYRCSGFLRDLSQYKGHILFRFADIEDAMAFKLRWV